jgi:Xaa-Pro aminopeptidase
MNGSKSNGVAYLQAQGKDSGKIWLGFERFTCVPIQMKMVKEDMLTKEEKQWLKVCYPQYF